MILSKLISKNEIINLTKRNAVLFQRKILFKKNEICLISPNLTFKTSTNKSKTKTSENYWNTSFLKHLSVFGIGIGIYFLASKLTNKKPETKIDDSDNPLFKLDLNEIYERTALSFLTNAELREVLGMPIKITTSLELDQVRSINLRREGSEVFCFIAYDVQGSINSGIVYCKLKMEKQTEQFKTVSIRVKLSKPDFKKRNQFDLVIENKEKKN